jgi:hypothetical protein
MAATALALQDVGMNVEEIKQPEAVDQDIAGLNAEMIPEEGIKIGCTTAEKEQFGL